MQFQAFEVRIIEFLLFKIILHSYVHYFDVFDQKYFFAWPCVDFPLVIQHLMVREDVFKEYDLDFYLYWLIYMYRYCGIEL